MIVVILILGVVFLVLGGFVNLVKTPILISGYVQMSEKEKQQFDLHAFSLFFKRFHIFLGISFIILSLLLYYSFPSIYSGLFVALYPILAYVFYILRIQKFSSNKNQPKTAISIGILSFVLVLTAFLFIMGQQDNTLSVIDNQITISGVYSESFSVYEIEKVSIVDSLPTISNKSNGYALGEVKKGYFKLTNGEKVKLVINSKTDTYLYIQLKSGRKIYFSQTTSDNFRIYKKITSIMQH